MKYRDLRDYMSQLAADGELKEITDAVSPCLEMTEISRRVLERQELVLPFPTGRDPLPWLAVTGTLLLLDVPPEELWRG